MPHRSTDLSDLAEQFFDEGGGTDLSLVGPACRLVRDTVTLFEDRTRPFVASVFWQAFLFTPSFTFFLEETVRRQPGLQVKLMQVVPHGSPHYPRFDLLILAEGLTESDIYFTTDARPLDRELREGSALFLEEVIGAGNSRDVFERIDHQAVALEALHAQPFGILLFPAPRMIPTASFCSPPVQVKVVDRSGETVSSTAGVRCANRSGQTGVTVAWHAVKDGTAGPVDVGGFPGRLVSHDVLSDSAFVEVPLPSGAEEVRRLADFPPRHHEPVTFTRIGTGKRGGKVTGWSPQLPVVTGNAQLVVTTDPISAPGDSGAALRDREDVLLGFGHETSEFGVDNPYSSWIWAGSVFKAHDLT